MRSSDDANRARALAAAAEAVRHAGETVAAMAILFRSARLGPTVAVAAPRRKRRKKKIGF